MAASTSPTSTASSQAHTSVLLLRPRSKARCTPIRTTTPPSAPSRPPLPSISVLTCLATLQCLNSRAERGRNAQTLLDQRLPLRPGLANRQWRDQCRLAARETSHRSCRQSLCSSLSIRHKNRPFRLHLPRHRGPLIVSRAQERARSRQSPYRNPSWVRPQSQSQLSNHPQFMPRPAQTRAPVSMRKRCRRHH